MSGSNEIWSHKHVDPQFDTSRQTLDAPALGLKGFKKAKLQRGRVILSAPYFWMDQCVWLFHWRYFLFAQMLVIVTSWGSLVIWPTKRSFHQTYKYDEKTNKLHQVGPKESTTEKGSIFFCYPVKKDLPQNCSNKPWSWRVRVGYPKHDQICCYLDNGTPGYLYIYIPHLANGPWNRSLNFIFPTKDVIPKSLKFSYWPSK